MEEHQLQIKVTEAKDYNFLMLSKKRCNQKEMTTTI